MKMCPKCNAQLDDDAVFCTGCGVKIEGKATEQTPDICQHCGNPLPVGTRFCTNCGTPVSDISRLQSQRVEGKAQLHPAVEPRPSRGGDLQKIIIAALIVLLAGSGGWYFYNERKTASLESTVSATANTQDTTLQESRNGQPQTNLDVVPENVRSKRSVYDNAKLLSQGEEEQLSAEIKRVEQQHGVRIGIVTQPSLQGRDIGKVANAILDQGFRGATNGGIVLLINMEKREWYISTDNAMRARVTDGEGIKYIQERMVPKISKGQYSDGFRNYVSAVEKMVTYYAKYGKPFKQ